MRAPSRRAGITDGSCSVQSAAQSLAPEQPGLVAAAQLKPLPGCCSQTIQAKSDPQLVEVSGDSQLSGELQIKILLTGAASGEAPAQSKGAQTHWSS